MYSGSSSTHKSRQKLILTTTSLHNVVIANASDLIYYEIVTPKWARNVTKISRLDPNTRQFALVGELQNGEDDKPVAMRLYGGAFKSTLDFLKDGDEEGRGEGGSGGGRGVEHGERGANQRQQQHRPEERVQHSSKETRTGGKESKGKATRSVPKENDHAGDWRLDNGDGGGGTENWESHSPGNMEGSSSTAWQGNNWKGKGVLEAVPLQYEDEENGEYPFPWGGQSSKGESEDSDPPSYEMGFDMKQRPEEIIPQASSSSSTSSSTTLDMGEQVRFSPDDPTGGKELRQHYHKAWSGKASFKGKDGRTYTWRGDQKNLELLREDMPDYPVATYHRQKRYLYVLRMSQHPYLEVDPAAMDTLDTLILSFLLIERRRRDARK